jgi:hypothetical protein
MWVGHAWPDSKVAELTAVKVLDTSLLNITVGKLCTDAIA